MRNFLPFLCAFTFSIYCSTIYALQQQTNQFEIQILTQYNQICFQQRLFFFNITQQQIESFTGPSNPVYVQINLAIILDQEVNMKKTFKPIMISGIHDISTFELRNFHSLNFDNYEKFQQNNIFVDFQNWNIQRSNFYALQEATIGEWAVLVYNTNSFQESFKVTLDVQLTNLRGCQNNCSLNGICYFGKCSCFSNFTGFDCSGRLKSFSNRWLVERVPIFQVDIDDQKDILIILETKISVNILFMINGLSLISLPSIKLGSVETLSKKNEKTYSFSNSYIEKYISKIEGQLISPFIQISVYSRAFEPIQSDISISAIKFISLNSHQNTSENVNYTILFIALSAAFLVLVFICVVCTRKIINNRNNLSPNRQSSINHNIEFNRQMLVMRIEQIERIRNDRHHRKEQKKATLNLGVIDKYMPITTYNDLQMKFPAINDLDPHCIICLMQFDLKDTCRMTICFHVFHSECLLSWLKVTENCPQCREPLDLRCLEDESVIKKFQNSKYVINKRNFFDRSNRFEENDQENYKQNLQVLDSDRKKLKSVSISNTPRFIGMQSELFDDSQEIYSKKHRDLMTLSHSPSEIEQYFDSNYSPQKRINFETASRQQEYIRNSQFLGEINLQEGQNLQKQVDDHQIYSDYLDEKAYKKVLQVPNTQIPRLKPFIKENF